MAQTLSDLEHFSHAVAHDPRAPLCAMHGYAALLERSLKDAAQPQTLDFSRRIRESAEQLDTLVQDSLNYAQNYVARRPFGPRRQHPDRGSLPHVLGNEAGLTQSFTNLLRNALKFVAPESRRGC